MRICALFQHVESAHTRWAVLWAITNTVKISGTWLARRTRAGRGGRAEAAHTHTHKKKKKKTKVIPRHHQDNFSFFT